MTTTADLRVDRAPGQAQTRIASYLLVEYLERLGVEVVFGLCGHTVIAFLDALGKSRIRFVSARHEQVAAHAADGYARASRKPGVLLTHLGPGLTNAATGVANAALDSDPDGGHRRRRAVPLLRPPPPSGGEPAPGRRSVPDLPALLQAGVPRGPGGRPAAGDRARVPPGPGRASGARPGRRAHGRLLRGSARGRVPPAARRRWHVRP